MFLVSPIWVPLFSLFFRNIICYIAYILPVYSAWVRALDLLIHCWYCFILFLFFVIVYIICCFLICHQKYWLQNFLFLFTNRFLGAHDCYHFSFLYWLIGALLISHLRIILEPVLYTNFSVVHLHLSVIRAIFSWNFFYPNLGHVAAQQFHHIYRHLALITDVLP